MRFKSSRLTFTLLALAILATLLTNFATAQETNYTITKVTHTIEILYTGHVSLNDTIEIEGIGPESFLVGLPYKHGSQVLRCSAYNSTHDFPVSLKVPFEDRVGFYAIRIDFPQGAPRTFSVGFLLSNELISQDPANTSLYTLDFPEYPGLTEPVSECTASLKPPEGSEYIDGTVQNTTYTRQDLPAFTFSPGNVTFFTPVPSIQLADVNTLARELKVGEIGGLEGSDTYSVTNRALVEASELEIVLPRNATNVRANDQLGRKLQTGGSGNPDTYVVYFSAPLETGKSTSFTVRYHLPDIGRLEDSTLKGLALRLQLLENLNCYINRASISIILPEGAKLLDFEAPLPHSYAVKKGIFEDTVTILAQDLYPIDNLNITLSYEYDILWLSFRPTLWMGALAIFGCAVATIWRRPQAPTTISSPKAALRLSPKDVKSFVDSYEEKRKIINDIDALKKRAFKGKIPRRRYKVRRRTLETRLGILTREIGGLKDRLRASGGQHRDFMRQLEVAETEMNQVETNIESIETRHRTGDLSLEAYRKLLGDYEKRKEKAEMLVNEILMRLREEIH